MCWISNAAFSNDTYYDRLTVSICQFLWVFFTSFRDLLYQQKGGPANTLNGGDSKLVYSFQSWTHQPIVGSKFIIRTTISAIFTTKSFRSMAHHGFWSYHIVRVYAPLTPARKQNRTEVTRLSTCTKRGDIWTDAWVCLHYWVVIWVAG